MKTYPLFTHVNIFPFFALTLLGFISIFSGYMATTMPMFFSVGIVLGIIVAIVTFIKPQIGLGLIVFSMLLSPEMPLAQLAKRAVVVRLDDLLLIGVFVAWITRSAIYKELPSFTKIPLFKPMSCYSIVCIVATVLGLIRGDIQPLTSFFYTAKYLEYFLLYFMVVSIVSNERQLEGYLKIGLVTAIIVCIHAYYWIAKGMRPYAPFDIEQGIVETASLAGYLMIVIGVAIGFFAHVKHLLILLAALGIIILAVPPLLSSESRATYAATIPMLLTSIFIMRRRRLALVGIILGLTFCTFWLGSEMVKKVHQRIMSTFLPSGAIELGREYALGQEYAIAGSDFAIEESAYSRVRSWKDSFTKDIAKHPFIGAGVTGVGLKDTNYPLILGETGLIGFCSFILLLVTILSRTFRCYRHSVEPVHSALNIGLLSVTVGVCVQAIAVNTFIIIRIMEPFWFLTALVMRTQMFKEEMESA